MIQNEWFEFVEPEDQIAQGDIFFSVPILKHPINPSEIKIGYTAAFEIEKLDGIILSQSCDLEQETIDMVLFCPIFPIDEVALNLADANTQKAIISTKERLWDGRYLAYHVLNKCELEGFNNDFFVVDLKNPRSLPIDFIKKLTELSPKRIRLKTPYREQLSQSFARVIMRVGIPDKRPQFG